MSPRIYLAIDNCFAAKRWCEPAEWMRVVRDLGLRYVEASADNEIDPLYSCPAYLDDWRTEVERESEKTGVRVVNCYSGHGTYATLGLGHHDPRIRAHLRENWMRPMIALAGRLGAGLGFFAHAFAERTLRDRVVYQRAYEDLIAQVRELAREAATAGVKTFGIEQMYTPHQVPWTVAGAEQFLRDANAGRPGAPVYLTLDTGHQCGQRRFLAPSAEQIDRFVAAAKDGRDDDIYLGPMECYRALAKAGRESVAAHVRDNPHLFATWDDGDTYRWIERFACYSPILHLQQTDGTVSAHKCFTRELNDWGVIHAPAVLRAIQQSARRESPPGFPPKLDTIWLTLEPFLPTAAHSRLYLDQIAESVAYWRRFVPHDGLEIDTLCTNLNERKTP
jgi:sugar phosphate isomerase/epimerase